MSVNVGKDEERRRKMTRDELKIVREAMTDYLGRLKHDEAEKFLFFKHAIEAVANTAGVEAEFDLDEPRGKRGDFFFTYLAPPKAPEMNEVPTEDWKWEMRWGLVRRAANYPAIMEIVEKLAKDYDANIFDLDKIAKIIATVEREIKTQGEES